jgi:hypothetical protein
LRVEINRIETLGLIHDSGILAVIRLNDTYNLKHIFDALAVGGVRTIEITLTIPNEVNNRLMIMKTAAHRFKQLGWLDLLQVKIIRISVLSRCNTNCF